MTLTIEDVVTHYILSSHPKNKAIIDIKDKKSGNLRYIKIRHRLPKFYAVSLVDPATFEVMAESQAKSATAKNKPIILHLDKKQCVKNDTTSVEFSDSSRIGFEWTFSWEGEKYKWVRESRMSNTLECKAIRKSGDICVAQYLPRILKDEYFGILSLLGYNILRCKLTKSHELELIIIMSLMTLLDKSNDGDWKKDQISQGTQDGILENYYKKDTTKDEDKDVLPVAYEDPIPKKSLQKKYKKELMNDQKLQLLLEKDVKRSQKQIKSDQKSRSLSISADNSPSQTPKTSPLPTPTTSSSIVWSSGLCRQKSTSILNSGIVNSSNISNTSNDSQNSQNSPTSSQHNSHGRLSKLFNSLHLKQADNQSITTITNSSLSNTIVDDGSLHKKTKSKFKIKKQMSQDYVSEHTNLMELKKMQYHNQTEDEQSDMDFSNHYHHQRSLPVGYSRQDFGMISIQNNPYENPPSLRSIRWNPEQSTPSHVVSNNYQQQYLPSRSSRRPNLEDKRRMSVSEYSIYTYNQSRYPHYSGEFNHGYNRYSSAEYGSHPYQQSHYYY